MDLATDNEAHPRPQLLPLCSDSHTCFCSLKFIPKIVYTLGNFVAGRYVMARSISFSLTTATGPHISGRTVPILDPIVLEY
jgi:hypothetical protein